VRSYFLYINNINLKCSQGPLQISINQTRFCKKTKKKYAM
jgi:hypothetical protein